MGVVVGAARIGIERERTNGGVKAAVKVVYKGIRSNSRVVAPGGVIFECISSVRRVFSAFRIAEERERSIGRVVRRRWCCSKAPLCQWRCFDVPSPVLWSPTLKRSVPAPTPVLKLPSVLLQSENQPTAVFPTPVVRLRRAFCPSAVLNPG